MSAQASAVEQASCRPVGQVKDIAPSAASAFPDYGPQPPVALGRRAAFFAANDGSTGLELYRSTGTDQDTTLVKDIHPGPGHADPRQLTALGQTLFFVADDGQSGAELWKTDGTGEGTVLVKDIRSGPEGADLSALTVMGDTLFFVANDGVSGAELWKSDGTPEGTVLVKDLVAGSQGAEVTSLAVFDGRLYFAADGGPHEVELWKSDGTEVGTERVAVVRVIESDPGEQVIRGLKLAGRTLYFFAGSAYGQQWDLWKSDGTEGGTSRVMVLSTGPDDFQAGPVRLTAVGAQVFFRAGQGGSLWRSDGTPGGTFLIKHSGDVRWLTALGHSLLFTAWDDASGYELWKSDGTTTGTTLVTDLRPGRDSSAPFWLTVVDSQVLFSAETPDHGRELWTTDGTLEGTQLLHDMVPGPASSTPSLLTVVGPRVYFLANDGANGTEPWVLNDCQPPQLRCPAPVTMEATSGLGSAVAWSTPRVSDNKPEPPVLTSSHDSGSVFPLGSSTVTFTATDESGNSAQCSLSVLVRDTKAPSLVCPPRQEVYRTTRKGAQVEFPPAQASDEVSTPKVTYGIASGSPFPVGSTPVRVTATDAAGNSTHCTFEVTVLKASEPQAQRKCGCGAASAGEAAGGLALMALALLGMRRRRA